MAQQEPKLGLKTAKQHIRSAITHSREGISMEGFPNPLRSIYSFHLYPNFPAIIMRSRMSLSFISKRFRLFLLTFITLSHCIAAVRAAQPNIIFILADDLGARDLGCYDSTFHETPNLDRLAKDGMRFTAAYAACNVCSPTRASILTGKYPARLRLTNWISARGNAAPPPSQKLKSPTTLLELPLKEVTIAEALKKAGYKTAFIGKWHLGETNFFPEKQGFDLNIAGCEKGHPPSYFSPYKIPNLSDGPEGEYLADRLTDEALRFIEQTKSKPFFLYLSHYSVHIPLQAKPELIKKYEARLAKQPSFSGPEFINEGASKVRQIQNQPVYAAMLQSLDESIGRIMDKLAELKIDQNTIIIFTSDNGGLSTAQKHPTSNAPLRAGKGWNYEGGIREPLLIKWPDTIKAGSICETPVISTDYYPTLLQMAGQPLNPEQHMDGTSLTPLFINGSLRERPLFWHYPHYSGQGGSPGGAVRLGDYKLVEWFEDMRTELYDLKNDPGEKHDLASQLPEKSAALKKLLHDWRKQIDAPMTSPNPGFKAAAVSDKKVEANN
jgi:arylsulfatase A-like enzyme